MFSTALSIEIFYQVVPYYQVDHQVLHTTVQHLLYNPIIIIIIIIIDSSHFYVCVYPNTDTDTDTDTYSNCVQSGE